MDFCGNGPQKYLNKGIALQVVDFGHRTKSPRRARLSFCPSDCPSSVVKPHKSTKMLFKQNIIPKSEVRILIEQEEKGRRQRRNRYPTEDMVAALTVKQTEESRSSRPLNGIWMAILTLSKDVEC